MSWSNLDLICRAMVWYYDNSTPSNSRMYMGLDGQLYRYNIAEDYYEFCDALEFIDDAGAPDDVDDYVITRLWNIDDGYIYGVGWKEDISDAKTIVLFKWDVTNSLESDITYLKTINNVFTGERTYYEWDKRWAMPKNDNYNYHFGVLGWDNTFVDDRFVLIPFSQSIGIGNPNKTRPSLMGGLGLSEYGDGFTTCELYKPANSTDFDTFWSIDTDSLGDPEYSINSLNESTITVKSGFYRIYAPSIVAHGSTDDSNWYNEYIYDNNPHFNITYGQSGLIDINSDGELLYAKLLQSSATVGAVPQDYFRDHVDVVGYSTHSYGLGSFNWVTIDSKSTNGDLWDLTLTDNLVTDVYNASDYEGCMIYGKDDANDYAAYIVSVTDASHFTVTSLRVMSSGSKDWDTLASNKFIITAPHYKCHLKTLDITGASLSESYVSDSSFRNNFNDTLDIYEKGNLRQPTSCMFYNNEWYFANFIRKYDGNISSRESYISKISTTADNTNIEDIYAPTDYEEYDIIDNLFSNVIILDLQYDTVGGTNYFIYTYMDLDNYGRSGFCGIAKMELDGSYSSTNIPSLDTFNSIPCNLLKKGNNVFYLALSDGRLYKVDTNAETVNLLGNGQPFVDNEYSLASNLVAISSGEVNSVDTDAERLDDLVMGVSSPVIDLESQESIPPGKYYLWKLDNYLSDRVELADFSDMNIWDAISNLLKLSYNHIGGFSSDENGSFFLKKKTFDDANVVLEISSDVQDDNLISLEKQRGLDEIYNYASLTPIKSKIGEVSFELVKQAREKEDKTFINTDDVFIDINTTYPLNYIFVCERTGNVDEDFNNLNDCSLFKWQIQEEPIEVRVLVDAAKDDSMLFVNSTFRGMEAPRDENDNINYSDEGVNVNDYIKVINDDNQTEKYIKISDITQDDFGYYRVLHLDSALPFDIDEGTLIEIATSFGLNSELETYDSKWSTDGVGTVQGVSGNSFYIDTKEYINVGTVVTADTRDLFRVSNIGDWSAGNGGWKIDTVSSGTSLDFAANDQVNAYYSSSKDSDGNYDYFEIGQSENKIKIEPSNDTNVTFKAGDLIRINSEGLLLEDDKASRQVSKNITSIDKYDKNELTDLGCRFLTINHAYHYARKIIDDYSYPKYKLTVVTDYSPDIDFIENNGVALIKVHNHPLFKPFNSIKCYIESIKHDIKGGTTTLVLKATEAY